MVFILAATLLSLFVAFAVGVVLDLPQFANLRTRMAQPHMKALGLIVGLSPALSYALGATAKIVALLGPKFGGAAPLALGLGSLVTAALAGSWLALPRQPNPRCRPRNALLFSLAIWLLNLWIGARGFA
jgi:hypothetical protein